MVQHDVPDGVFVHLGDIPSQRYIASTAVCLKYSQLQTYLYNLFCVPHFKVKAPTDSIEI